VTPRIVRATRMMLRLPSLGCGRPKMKVPSNRILEPRLLFRFFQVRRFFMSFSCLGRLPVPTIRTS